MPTGRLGQVPFGYGSNKQLCSIPPSARNVLAHSDRLRAAGRKSVLIFVQLSLTMCASETILLKNCDSKRCPARLATRRILIENLNADD